MGKRERPGVIVTPDYNAPWHSDATPLVLGGSAPLRPPALPTPASVGAWAHIIPLNQLNYKLTLLKFSENYDLYFVDVGIEILYVMLNIGMIENKHNCTGD